MEEQGAYFVFVQVSTDFEKKSERNGVSAMV